MGRSSILVNEKTLQQSSCLCFEDHALKGTAKRNKPPSGLKTILSAGAIALLALALLLLGGAAWADNAPRYTVVPLQNLPGREWVETYCRPTALSNVGEAVGTVGGQAVRWDAQGEAHLLTTTPALHDVQAINAKGQMLGYASLDQYLDARLLLLGRDGQAHLLDTLPGFVLPAGTSAMGFNGGLALNDAGQIAFNTRAKAGRPQRGYLYDHGTLTDLGHLPMLSYETGESYTRVNALSAGGEAAGDSETHVMPAGIDTYHAFLWRKGVMTDLGVPAGYDRSSAAGLDDRGDVIGTMQTDAESQDDDSTDEVHGFVWQNGKLTDLGTLPGCTYTQPTGINSHGQVVGDSYLLHVSHDLPGGATGFSRQGGALNGAVFLWQNGTMTDLQKLVPAGWQLQSAVAINDRGDILCTGYHAGMPSPMVGGGAFILRPMP